MAFVLTYDSLRVAVQDYLERTDARLVHEIPLFIMLGERRVARDLKILGLKATIGGTLIEKAPLFQKPTRWLNDASFSIGTGTTGTQKLLLKQRSYEWCVKYWPDATNLGQPKYYSSDYNYNVWFVVPTPDQAYPYEISYFQTPELIDETTSTNFLTGSAPDILLYATLLETASYLKDDERVQVWLGYYEKAKTALSNEDKLRIYDHYSERSSNAG